MARIRLRNFAGELPAINPHKLPDHNARIARNVKLWSGSLKPLRGFSSLQVADYVDPATIFKYTPTVWFQFEEYHDVVRSPSFNDSYKRAYFVGPSASGMRVTDTTLVGGVSPFPNSSYLTGVPFSTTAPTFSVTGSGSGTAESRLYVYTAVNGWGEEGPPSPVSAVATVQAGQTVNLTLTAVSAGSYKPITKYYIYRSNNGGASYQYVGETATTSFADNTFSLPYGQEELPSAEWDAPPTDIKGLLVLPNGVVAGFRNNEVLFSEPGLPHAWPVRYRVPLEYVIVRLGLVDGGVAVMTEGKPYLVLGAHPGSMSAVPLDVPYKCVAARGVVQIGGTVVYPTPRGLAAIDSSGARMLTETVWDDDDWPALNPSTLISFQWRGLYVGFHTDLDGVRRGFLLNPAQLPAGIVTFEGVPLTAGYEDPGSGDLFVVVNSQIQQWDAGDALTYVYRSPPREQAAPVAMSVLQVLAEAYPVIVAIYRDGVLQDRVMVGENWARRIAGAELGRSYEIEVIGTTEVREVVLASNMGELKRV